MLKMLIRKAKNQKGIEEVINTQPLKNCVLKLIPIQTDYEDIEVSTYCLVCYNKETDKITHCIYDICTEYHNINGKYVPKFEKIVFRNDNQ